MIFNLIAILIVLVLLVFSISKLKIHPFIVLILAAICLGVLVGLDGEKTISVLLEGFGSTMKWIAIVVILGAFIGEVLHETGGAIRIAKKILKWTGQKRLPWAMGFTGYIVSIPVFVDVAYILFQPITEGLARRSKTPLLVVGLSLAAGLTVSHTLMPPTPGPLAVASILNADLGKLLLINSFVAIFVVIGGVLWAKLFCKKIVLDFDKQSQVEENKQSPFELNNLQKSIFLLDLMPIVVPIILMAGGAFFTGESKIEKVLHFLGIPMVAVLIGASIAAIQFFRVKTKTKFNDLVEAAIVKSALVIMITGAGGAFGYVIRASGVQDSLGEFFASMPYLGFLLPFIIAAVLTTATGSITVSLIGSASILVPLVSVMPYSAEMMAALIGCGSFCVFHANSSFFWLLNRLHKIPVNILYKTFTLQSLIMGFSGLFGVIILYLIGVR